MRYCNYSVHINHKCINKSDDSKEKIYIAVFKENKCGITNQSNNSWPRNCNYKCTIQCKETNDKNRGNQMIGPS